MTLLMAYRIAAISFSYLRQLGSQVAMQVAKSKPMPQSVMTKNLNGPGVENPQLIDHFSQTFLKKVWKNLTFDVQEGSMQVGKTNRNKNVMFPFYCFVNIVGNPSRQLVSTAFSNGPNG